MFYRFIYNLDFIQVLIGKIVKRSIESNNSVSKAFLDEASLRII